MMGRYHVAWLPLFWFWHFGHKMLLVHVPFYKSEFENFCVAELLLYNLSLLQLTHYISCLGKNTVQQEEQRRETNTVQTYFSFYDTVFGR
jgi:hypothetical protein